MRVLFANDGADDAGGVQRYIDATAAGLRARGHDIAFLHRDSVAADRERQGASAPPRFSIDDLGVAAAIDAARAWAPDVCFSHNMNALDVDRRLAGVAPLVKFMHGYFGTCVSGLKRFGLPVAQPCDRVFGAACAALYLPRRCGQASVTALVRQFRWASEQHDLFSHYRAIVVASRHMEREFVQNGVDPAAIHVVPLFPTIPVASEPQQPGATPSVAFLGRMTSLKGGDVLIRAVAAASAGIRATVHMTMIGDGPQRSEWEALAGELRVDCLFTGWQTGPSRFDAVRRADLLAVPSVWPEPFGLVGLEASALGVPAIAFDVGGIAEWLRPGVNGVLVPADPPRPSTFADALADILSRRAALAEMRPHALAVAREMSLARHLDRLESIFQTCEPAERRPTSTVVARRLQPREQRAAP
jgi:glycosyltransferase involved in cell wall biosynthesis